MERDFSITPLLINHQAHPGKNSWVKIFIYDPAEIETLQSRGTMYAVLSLSAKTSVDFTAIMQSILEEIHTQYYQQTSGSILQALEKTLDTIHKNLILLGQEDKRLNEGFNFNLLTAVSWGTVLYFGQLGSSRAALLRDGKLFDIDEGEQKTTNLYLSSGVLQSQDKVILGTSQFFKRFNRTNLKKALSLPQEKIVAALESELNPGLDRSSESAIVLTVDIKHVPSPVEEGLHIKDPVSPTPQTASPAPHSSSTKNKLGWLDGVKQIGLKVWRLLSWKIGNLIPVAPLLLVILAIAALLYSLNGGGKWKPMVGPNEALISSATEVLSQAKSVSGVNPDRAMDLLEQANKYIGDGMVDYPQNPELLKLQSEAEELERRILVTTELDPKEVTQISVGHTQPKLAVNDGDVFLIDSQKQELIRINSSGDVRAIASNFRFAEGSLLAMTESGLLVVARGHAIPVTMSGSIGEAVSLPDTVQSVSMTGYSQNGYVLDASGQIYRVPNQGGAIGSISNYFIRPVGGSTLVDLAVDGYIYLLREDGVVDLYLNGEKQPLTLERGGLAKGGKAIFTHEGIDRIYILHDSAVFAWSKEGKYIGQYTLPSQDSWQMAAIDVENSTLFVLIKNKLVKANLPG